LLDFELSLVETSSCKKGRGGKSNKKITQDQNSFFFLCYVYTAYYLLLHWSRQEFLAYNPGTCIHHYTGGYGGTGNLRERTVQQAVSFSSYVGTTN